MAYERGVEHWERTGGDEGVPPVPDDLNNDLGMMRVAKELGIPVTHLARTPRHWITAALVRLEWEHQEHERQSRRRTRRAPENDPRRSR